MLKAKTLATNKTTKTPKKSASVLTPPMIKKCRQDNIRSTYNQYFSSGFYKKRYPRINQCTAKFIEQYILQKRQSTSQTRHILDYGCGNGRYLLNLLKHHRALQFIAYDISPAPLEILQHDLQAIDAEPNVTIISHFDALYQHMQRHHTTTPIDAALLLFGVLSHIASPIQRQDVLRFLRLHLGQQGHLILSVPNKRRRFTL